MYLINTFKRKLDIDKSKLKTAIIYILKNADKKSLPILASEAKLLIFATRKVDIIIIGVDTYCTTYKLKKV